MAEQDSLFPNAVVDAAEAASVVPAGAAGAADSSSSHAPGLPLAERLRPASIDDVIGQPHLLGPGRPLRVAIESSRLHSMILWGPPGVGKTTLARLLAASVAANFVALSAVLAGVKEIREAVEKAHAARAGGRGTVVFVDEVHRFNKSQQDAFLPHVESGLFTFIGATTENPSFEVNSALLSRATVHVLHSLSDDDLRQVLSRAQRALPAPALTDAASARLIAHADGDARRLINAWENLVSLLGADPGRQADAQASATPARVIDEAELELALGSSLRRYDKGGDGFYDTISALHKSVRGSNPDAALYWLARMIDGGVDPRYIVRRVLRMASEDIGLADPRGLRLALDAAEVYERLGSPEGELAIAQAVVYLAVAPKSDSVYSAWKAAQACVRDGGSLAVPMHLRNAPTRLMKKLGHGEGYRHAHNEAGAYAAGENYWPEALPAREFYRPAGRGLESKIADKLAELRRLDAQAADSQ
jgi:putative ATPase